MASEPTKDEGFDPRALEALASPSIAPPPAPEGDEEEEDEGVLNLGALVSRPPAEAAPSEPEGSGEPASAAAGESPRDPAPEGSASATTAEPRSEPASAPRETPAPRSEPEAADRGRWLGGGLVAVLLLAAAGWWISRQGQAGPSAGSPGEEALAVASPEVAPPARPDPPAEPMPPPVAPGAQPSEPSETSEAQPAEVAAEASQAGSNETPVASPRERGGSGPSEEPPRARGTVRGVRKRAARSRAKQASASASGSSEASAHSAPAAASPASEGTGAASKKEESVEALLNRALGGAQQEQAAEGGEAAASSSVRQEENLPETPNMLTVRRSLSGLMPLIRRCAEGEAGVAMATIDVSHDGKVQRVSVSGAPFGGTPKAKCMEDVVRSRARFPRFRRPTFRIRYPFAVRPPAP